MKRREDRVRAALPGAKRADVVHRGQAGVGNELDPSFATGLLDSPITTPREYGLTSAVRWTASAFTSMGKLRQFMLGRPAPHYEAGTAHPQRSVEVGETLEQELCARPGRMATVQKTVVEAEHRHDSVAMVERSTQRRMVVQPQIAAKPEEGGQCEIRPRVPAVGRRRTWAAVAPIALGSLAHRCADAC